MIKLEKLNASDAAEVGNITVCDDQVQFVGTAKEFLADKTRRRTCMWLNTMTKWLDALKSI